MRVINKGGKNCLLLMRRNNHMVLTVNDEKNKAKNIKKTMLFDRDIFIRTRMIWIPRLSDDPVKQKTTVTFTYAKEVYERQSIERFSGLFVKAVEFPEDRN